MKTIALSSVLALTVLAQPQANRLEFDVATVKLSPPPSGNSININLGGTRNGRLDLANATLSDCVKFAYGIVSDAQLAGPDWMNGQGVPRFDIVGQAPADTPREQLLLMLQTLLADRLKLAVHHEQRNLSHLALVTGKSGPKMREVSVDPTKPARNSGVRGHIAGSAMSMQVLATLLSRFERETVVDMTGLNGLFEVNLEWTPDKDPGAVTDAVESRPTLFTAVQEQLGLRLESRKGPVEVLVIDHAEKTPKEN